NPVWVQFVSRKLLRLAVPWALLALLTLTLLLLPDPIYTVALEVQGGFYGLALAGLLLPRPGRVSSAAASFVVLNAAAWVAFWVWASGRAGRSWSRVVYPVGEPPLARRVTVH